MSTTAVFVVAVLWLACAFATYGCMLASLWHEYDEDFNRRFRCDDRQLFAVVSLLVGPCGLPAIAAFWRPSMGFRL